MVPPPYLATCRKQGALLKSQNTPKFGVRLSIRCSVRLGNRLASDSVSDREPSPGRTCVASMQAVSCRYGENTNRTYTVRESLFLVKYGSRINFSTFRKQMKNLNSNFLLCEEVQHANLLNIKFLKACDLFFFNCCKIPILYRMASVILIRRDSQWYQRCSSGLKASKVMLPSFNGSLYIVT